MKVVLAGAYGNLGADIFKSLLKAGHEVIAADMIQRDLGVAGNYTFKKIDVQKPDTLKGLCDGADVVITTVGLTKTSAEVTNYQIDYQGKMYDVGGKETYSYEEIANLCFAAARKEPVIKRAPAMLFEVLAFVNHFKKNGKEAILRFSKWTLTEEYQV